METLLWHINSLRPSDAYIRRWTSHHCLRYWRVVWPAPSHYLKQYWNIVNWTIWSKFQWNFNRNSNILIHENELESVVCKMASILSRPQWVNTTCLTHWGRMTQIYASKQITIGSDNVWSHIFIEKIHLKMSSAKWRQFVSASMCKISLLGHLISLI